MPSLRVEKDTSVAEIYPYPDDSVVTDQPVDPLFAIDCQGGDWRVAIVCHHCLHRLNPDLWISERCWEGLDPVTPFGGLPFPVDEGGVPGRRFDVELDARR